MKRVFFGITYIILLSLMFSYMLISRGFNGVLSTNVLGDASRTGISIIGFMLIIPAFVFAIISICVDKKGTNFCRDMFTCFSSAFCIASGIICLFTGTFDTERYIPIVLACVSLIAFALSLVGVIKTLKNENK